jgi:hypothetical protein
MMQFDDDMAHFVTHLDADPLAESQLKMQLIEYNALDDANLVREITDDEDEYTYFPSFTQPDTNVVGSSRSKSCLTQR